MPPSKLHEIQYLSQLQHEQSLISSRQQIALEIPKKKKNLTYDTSVDIGTTNLPILSSARIASVCTFQFH